MSETQDTFRNTLLRAISPWNLDLSSAQLDQLGKHYALMIETNREMNLTRITDPVEAAARHYADSLALVACARAGGLGVRTVLDIGTGAGFPAIPVAVARPDWSLTAIDAARKKTRFVRRAVEALGLPNLCCQHAHSAHWRPEEPFDLAVMRAVADPLEVARRFVGTDGLVAIFEAMGPRSGEHPPIDDRPVRRRFNYTLPTPQGSLSRAIIVVSP